ncbi:toxic anion resistance protein [Candidatus Accumulibacter cognatus]|uniref:Toxic anion resistance protein (TelA) n=1 Tax=Candidatus Accumulibacter cognatus TaxID=2954383 RepID=A0A080M8A7_9PROT|nr:toxic anion resistance protein [Candidatus Accumulibacter cognatus]KFB76695.1 MAG: Toxic anion resistance protein (TelA) [Candidatus Accumulibacter cognatus]
MRIDRQSGTAAEPAFQLTPPEVMAPVHQDQAVELVTVKPERLSEIEQQVESFLGVLMSADLHSQDFKDKLDQTFALGRQEVSVSAALLQGRLLEKNFVSAKETPAFQAISELRGELDKLNPGNQGNLLEPKRLLGLIPWGSKLQSYFRRYQTAATQIKVIMGQLYAARDEVQKDLLALESQRGKIWDGMQKMAEAIRFAEMLDTRLAQQVEGLRVTDPLRAKALEQEVQFYARQNLQDMLTQQAVSINGYLALDVIKKTGRELINGCTRVATTGMSALAVAQTVARATGNQVEVMDMLQGVSGTIGRLIQQTGEQLNAHVSGTTRFAENPLLGIEEIKQMFAQTYQAMDAIDDFRSQAITVMGRNNEILQSELARSREYLDRVRRERAGQAIGDTAAN